ncbi:serine protease [Streptacidiphilus sp. EB129]|uniref:trypsin-like serine peptidase n=1 Tax=Streptacidiphilus sp. EB129 TaxID=3156262 RepID=UPI0035168D55
MPDAESGTEVEPGARTARLATRRRIAAGVSLAVLLGTGSFVAATTAGGVSASRLLRAVDASSSEPIPSATAKPTASARSSRSPSAAKGSSGTGAMVRPSATAPAAVPSGPVAGTGTGPAPASAAPAAKVDAPPTTPDGQTLTLAQDQQPSQVGAVFQGSLASGHNCTASVVDSPAGDMIVTAAHCLAGGSGSATFVPAYRDGSAPYGEWQISQVLEDSAWTGSQNPDDDVAFALVKPLNGRTLESVVGAYSLDTAGTSSAQVQITGYPGTTNEPISCTGASSAFSATQLTVYCTGYTDGTSGSGWISDYNPTTGSGAVMGVIGGYQTGGDTPDVSYTALFGSGVQALYDQAVAVG